MNARACEHCGEELGHDEQTCYSCIGNFTILKRLWRYAHPQKYRLLFVGVIAMSTTILGVLPPLIMGPVLIDRILLREGVEAAQKTQWLCLAISGAIGIYLLVALLNYVGGKMAAKIGAKVNHAIRQDFYESVNLLSIKRYSQLKSGDLVSRLSGDAPILSNTICDIMNSIVPAVAQFLVICIVLLLLKWSLALVVIVPAVLYFLYGRHMTARFHACHKVQSESLGEMASKANNVFNGHRLVKAYNQEQQENDAFREYNAGYSEALAVTEVAWATITPFMRFLTQLSGAAIWLFGGLALLHGRGGVTLGTLIAFTGYLAYFHGPLNELVTYSGSIGKALTASKRLFGIIDLLPERKLYQNENAVRAESLQGSIEFREVHFGYGEEDSVLKGVSFAVQPGEMVGIVGRSCEGKTTIINLLMRFYDFSEGDILIDGRGIAEYDIQSLRQHTALVPQQGYVFNATVAENIAYGCPQWSEESLKKAAKKAFLHEAIMRLPKGYETVLGEGGQEMSGGELQRIGIARALLRDPRILILDEATSSLDIETESVIHESLQNLCKNLCKNRTTIAIAHRLSTLQNADRIILLDDGVIAESGTHRELLLEKNRYYSLSEKWRCQSAIRAV